MTLFDRHLPRLQRAIEVSRTREAWSPFQESPSRKHHPEGAPSAGRAAFQAHLGRSFELDQPGEVGRVGQETSPFTGESLGIDYPDVDVEQLYAAMHQAWPAWRRATPQERVGVGLEMLHRWEKAAFENAYATMHTAGQPFMLAFAGSGASSLERGLEGLTYAWRAMSDIPPTASFDRHFGRSGSVHLSKRYRILPVGISVVIACGSYPAWNAYPAMLASLVTGNPVVVKPHPASILPMAIAVRIGREVLRDAGFDPNVLTLAADTRDRPITKPLVQHAHTRLVDFTGSPRFGRWLQENVRHAEVFTETSGCNSVVLDSADDLDAVLHAVAHGLCFFSAQMCTAAQNIWLPAKVRTPGGDVPASEVERRLVAAVDQLMSEPSMAAGLCGALCSEAIRGDMSALAERPEITVIRKGTPYEHPEFPKARTATPLIGRVSAADRELYGREWFGPMSFVIHTDSRETALAGATRDAAERGAIASYAYTTDPAFLATVQDAFADAGASVGINLRRQLPINFAAAFSDFHVTGANPAGTATLTDLRFVAQRFRVVQSKVEG